MIAADDESEAIDRADLRAQDAWARKQSKTCCSECRMTGFHLNGCPEAGYFYDDEGDDE